MGTLTCVILRERTVRKALDDDESFGFALARFDIEEGDRAYNPDEPRRMIDGPARLTYQRRDGRTTVRIT